MSRTNTDSAPERWAVDLTCCGHDDGTAIRQTYEDADALREGYLTAQGHTRTAIVRKVDCYYEELDEDV